MTDSNKTVLEKANSFILKGDNEGFLSFCTENTLWTFVGDKTLHGKSAVRAYMTTAYAEPPNFTVDNLIEGGNYVTALGKITMKDDHGITSDYSYCDVWRFENGRMAELKAFVIKI